MKKLIFIIFIILLTLVQVSLNYSYATNKNNIINDVLSNDIANIVDNEIENNLLDDELDNCLLFEVYYNGNTIDPEDFYNMKIEDLQ